MVTSSTAPRSTVRPPRRPGSALAAGILATGVLAAGALPLAATTPALARQAGRAAMPARRPPAGIAAAAAELANGATGRQLWGRRQYAARPIASLTKVMTAYVVITSGHLGRYITITRADVSYVGCCIASAGLKAGDVITARQLLYAMLLPSGADAARALAVAYGPGIRRFVAKMNAAAHRLHLVRSRFTNFDGVPASDVSTPRNLLLLGEAAMRLPVFRAVAKSRWHRLRAGRLHHAYFWRNRNLLLRDYPGVIGIKTGWTPAAGECLLFEATHGHRELIGVVLDSSPTQSGRTFTDAARLLNWGFGLHEPVPAPRRARSGPLD